MNGERSEPAVTCSCSREKFGENRQILANYEGGLYATVSNLRSISVSLFFSTRRTNDEKGSAFTQKTDFMDILSPIKTLSEDTRGSRMNDHYLLV